MIAEAEQIIFMGFGFHQQNMALLTPDVDMHAKRVFTTVYQEPGPAMGTINNSLADLYNAGPTKRHPAPIDLVGLSSREFMSQYYSPLTA